MENHINKLIEDFIKTRKNLNNNEPYYTNLSIDRGNLYNNVCIVGGGLAGYLTAIAFRKFFRVPVTVIEAPNIPIIGVGEATTPILQDYLFDALGFDREEFYKEVQPTWKLGIKFFWGKPGDYFFNYPFDRKDILSAMHFNNDINYCSLNSLLMSNNTSFVMRQRDKVVDSYYSLHKDLKHAFHIDNKKFVNYLKSKAEKFGVQFKTLEIKDALLNKEGIDYLVDNFGEKHKYDLYVDCSGFRSFLLENKLKSKYISYSGSLFNNRAITSVTPQEVVNTFTLAETMNNGWCWTIPTRGENHVGYVFSSEFCSDEKIYEELLKKKPDMSKDVKFISFKSGRHDEFIKGNVVAIGNSYSFVEPLESTGVHMIIHQIITLMNNFINLKGNATLIDFLNKDMNSHWDYIRWFLSIHFKFNKKYSSEYWKESRSTVDISGFENLIALYKEIGFLSFQDTPVKEVLKYYIHDNIFDVYGIDHILAGQGVLPGNFSNLQLKNKKDWFKMIKIWEQIVSNTVPVKDDLTLLLDNLLIKNKRH